MIYLKQSTASQEIPLGPFLDSTDGDTAETGLTIANTDIKLWKAGATTLANKNSGGATHISGGIYYCVLDATDTNTLGPLIVFVHVSGALAVRVACVVLAANVYDSLVAASDNLQVDTTQIEGSDATTQIGTAVAASAVASVTGNVGGNVGGTVNGLTSTAQGHVRTAVGLASANLDTQISGLSTKLDTIDDYVDTEVAAIKAKTDNLPASPAASGDIPSAATVASAVRTELATELAHLDEDVSSRAAPGDAMALVTDAVDALALASDAVAELQSGLSTLDTDDIPTASDIASATLTAAQTTPIRSDIRKVNNVTLTGTGTAEDQWRPA